MESRTHCPNNFWIKAGNQTYIIYTGSLRECGLLRCVVRWSIYIYFLQLYFILLPLVPQWKNIESNSAVFYRTMLLNLSQLRSCWVSYFHFSPDKIECTVRKKETIHDDGIFIPQTIQYMHEAPHQPPEKLEYTSFCLAIIYLAYSL